LNAACVSFFAMPRKAVLALLVDGARADVVANMAAAGELPTLKRHFIDRGGSAVATSVFPTVSGPAHLPLLAGVHPASANLPGIRWAERPSGGRGWFLGRTRSYMAPFRAWKLERDIPAKVSTLFAHVPSMADINTWFVRGCPAGARRTRWSKPTAFLRALVTRNWQSSEDQAEHALLCALDQGFTSVHAVFPAIDELGHRFGPLSEPSFEAYRRFDRALQRILDALARRGQADDTLIVISSDHGQTATHTHIDIDAVVAQVYPRTVCYPKIWRYSLSAQAAVMVSGNSMANLYVQGAGGWHERPDFDLPDSQSAALKARLLEHPAIEHVIYRAREADSYVVANREGSVRFRIELGEEKLGSKIHKIRMTSEGKNPLGYVGVPEFADRDAIARLTADSEYPDAPWQIARFFSSRRAGDLAVCARHGFDLRARFEYQPHNGSHGGLHRDHMLVPALTNGHWAKDRMRTVDLFPSILAALGLPIPPGIDGETVAID
jgi:hypothetical protein